MENQPPISLGQISSEEWDKTPESIKRLVAPLLLGTAGSQQEICLVQLLDAMPIGISVHDAAGQLVYLNQFGRSLLGFDRRLGIGLAEVTEVFQIYRWGTPSLYPAEALPIALALGGTSAWADDLEIRLGDRAIGLEVWATPILNEQGQVTHAIAAFQDISDRKRREMERQIVENTLLQSERRYRQVIQAQTDLILRSQPDTRITFANDALCAALGQPLEQVLGRRWSDFVPAEDLDEIYPKIAALTPENPIFENINRDQRANQQVGWTQWINLGIFDEQGNLVEIQSVGRDITNLQTQIQRERSLNRVFQTIRNSLDLDTIFATATAEASHLLEDLDCFVVQYLPQQGIWKHVAEYRHEAELGSTLGFEIADAGNPFAAQLKQLQIVRVNDTALLEDPTNQDIACTLPGAWLLIPLVVEGHLWGSLTLMTRGRSLIWRDDQVQLAQAIAGQLEIAIQQANLYQQVQLELAERRRVETALRESEARFQNMAANVPGAIFRYLLRPDGTDGVLYMSQGCVRLWEVEAQAVVTDASLLWQMVHPEDLPEMRASVMESAQTLEPWSWAWRITTPSGQEKWLEAAGRPTRYANGDIIWDTLILDVTDRKRAEDRLQALASNLPGAVYQYVLRPDGSDDILYVSRGCQDLWEIEPQTILQDVGVLWHMVHPEDVAPMRESILLSATTFQPWNWQWRITTPSGHQKWLQASARPQRQANGDVIWDGIILDVTERQAALEERERSEAALGESEARYRLLAENTSDLVCLHDLDGRYRYVSPSCEFLLGYQYEEMLGQTPQAFIHPEEGDRLYQEAYAAAVEGKPSPITYRMRHQAGHYIWFETLIKPIFNADGQPVQMLTTSRDVTERVLVQNQLKHDAVHDALTGLPNRYLLMERLELAISKAQTSEAYRFAVLFLDLDRFKVINDSLGHLVGDQLLIAIAQKVQSTLREVDLAARLGGDEFVILLEEISDIQEAVQAAERIFAQVQVPLQLEGREVYTTASAGIVLGTADYKEASGLLRDADIAMYRAKSKGKARYEIFDGQMHTQALQRLHLENDLRRAIAAQEFTLCYQPIIDLTTGALVSFEALIRWHHPTQGTKSPAEFIAVAEELGLVTQVDYWSLRTACQQIATWQQRFPQWGNLKVAVNLSAQDLRRADLLEEVDRVLAQNHLSADCLTLEITESMLIEDVEATIHLLEQLKQRGIHISIDDFGTGYSSLSYLHRLPLDYLKVDQSFVRQMEVDPRNYQIVETIMALSNQLALGAIAEGIETESQLEQLRQLGYRFGQGYFFSRPLTPAAAALLIQPAN
ncbi:bifunctional diguanylate cyclase/phosphodiesterase [Thermoleptolyngbya sp.]